MKIIGVLKWVSITSLIAALMFTSAVFTVLVYGKIAGNLPNQAVEQAPLAWEEPIDDVTASDASEQEQFQLEEVEQPRPEQILFEAPLVLQYPELPRGCEITTLTMMLQYKGLDVDKMELLPDLPRDPTPIEWDPKGGIKFWGNPHTGFIGDITLNSNGFGIYHTALFELAKKYAPTAIDMTGESFDAILDQVGREIPVMVWVTTKYREPDSWVEWDSPLGLVRTTYQQHTVLIVGYDHDSVYINDPLNSQAQLKVNMDSFIKSWESLGEQAISYVKDEYK